LYKGLELPARGSIKDEILKELVWRERNERASAIRLLVNVIRRGLGIPHEELNRMLNMHTDIVTQNRYTVATMRKNRKEKVDSRRKTNEDKKRLEKLDKLTVSDEELTTPKKKKRKR
jgi:hypothetical protein